MASAGTARLRVRVSATRDALPGRRFCGESPESGGRLQVLGLLLPRRARMLFAPAIPLLGTMDLVRGSPEPLFHRRVWVRHTHDDLLLLPLPAHVPMRCRICRAWWRA